MNILHGPKWPTSNPGASSIVIEWLDHFGARPWVWWCQLFGHRASMTNPSAYDCLRCGTVGHWRYQGHSEACYTKYSGGRCFCNPPRELIKAPQLSYPGRAPFIGGQPPRGQDLEQTESLSYTQIAR